MNKFWKNLRRIIIEKDMELYDVIKVGNLSSVNKVLSQRDRDELPSRKDQEAMAKNLGVDISELDGTRDVVDHPSHYCHGGIECIDAIKSACTGLKDSQAFFVGNVIKYMWRWHIKNGLEDLKKARWYLNKLIEEESGCQDQGKDCPKKGRGGEMLDFEGTLPKGVSLSYSPSGILYLLKE